MTRRLLFIGTAFAFARKLRAAGSASLGPVAGATLVLEVAKTGLLSGKTHKLVFTDYRGEIAGQPPASQVTFTVRAASMRCEDTWVNEKDRVKIQKYGIDELLEAKRYPEIRFVSTSVRQKAGAAYSIEGNLTIRNQTRPVVVAVEQEAANTEKPWWKGSAVVILSDFGLKAPKAALGTIGTKDETRLAFRLMAG